MKNTAYGIKLKRTLCDALFILALSILYILLANSPADFFRVFVSEYLPYIKIGALILLGCSVIYLIMEKAGKADESGEVFFSGNMVAFSGILTVSLFLLPMLYEQFGRDSARYIGYVLIIALVFFVLYRIAPRATLIFPVFILAEFLFLGDLWSDVNSGEGSVTGISFGGVIFPIVVILLSLIFKKLGGKIGRLVLFDEKDVYYPVIILSIVALILYFTVWMRYISGYTASLIILILSVFGILIYVFRDLKKRVTALQEEKKESE